MNRMRRQDEQPSKHVMALYLMQRGWKRMPMLPHEHEPVRWIDPLKCVGAQRFNDAWELQQRRDRAPR